MSMMSVFVICVCVSLFVGSEAGMGMNDIMPDPKMKGGIAGMGGNDNIMPDPKMKDKMGDTCMMNLNANLKMKWQRMFDYYDLNNDMKVRMDDFSRMYQNLQTEGFPETFVIKAVQLAGTVLRDALMYLPGDDKNRKPEQGVNKMETVAIFAKQMMMGELKINKYRKDLYDELVKLPGAGGKLTAANVEKFEKAMKLNMDDRKMVAELIDGPEISKMAYVSAYSRYFTDTSPTSSLDMFPLFGKGNMM